MGEKQSVFELNRWVSSEDRRVFRSIIHCHRRLLGQVLILSWSWLFVTLAGLAATKDNCIVWPKSTNQSSDPSSTTQMMIFEPFSVSLLSYDNLVALYALALFPARVPSEACDNNTTVATLFSVENV